MEMFEVPVHLFLFVKVREKWADDPERYREMGCEVSRIGKKPEACLCRCHAMDR